MAFNTTAVTFALNAQKDALRFAEADANSNMQLDFDEFLEMQPKRIRMMYPEETIREWFHAADVDGDGCVSVDEFFMWTLGRQSLKGLDSLRGVFNAYDRDATGYLDASEFHSMCVDMGFGAAANEIFELLDHDETGFISYNEIIVHLQQQGVDSTQREVRAGRRLSPTRARADGGERGYDGTWLSRLHSTPLHLKCAEPSPSRAVAMRTP